MTKEDLIKQISAETKISKDTTTTIVESLLDCVKTSIANGEDVTLRGFGTFQNVLRHQKTYQEIQPEWMQAINGLRKGDILPELRDILEENFIADADGRWRIADPEKQADLDKLHLKSLMKEFNIYVEAASKPKAKPIKNSRVEAVRAGFRECYKKKDFATIIKVGDKIPQNLLQEDEQLLRYYDVATRHV